MAGSTSTLNLAWIDVDVDLIESARACLRYLWPRLQGESFFTHEAFNRTYMEGLLDEAWWPEEIGEIATPAMPVHYHLDRKWLALPF